MGQGDGVTREGRPCPCCTLPLLERTVSDVERDAPFDPVRHVLLLQCANGHEFAWREGLPDLLPKREQNGEPGNG
jgi:hypothetical protein